MKTRLQDTFKDDLSLYEVIGDPNSGDTILNS